MSQEHQRAAALRLSRSLFVLLALATGLALAYLPAQPGVAVAETADTASPAPGLESSPSPDPAGLDPTPSPTLEPAASPSPDPALEPSPDPSTAPTADPSASPVAAFAVMQHAFARVATAAAPPTYLAPGAPLTDEPRYEVFRISFDLTNADALDRQFTPLLEFSSDGTTFARVPDETTGAEAAFHVAREWVAQPNGGTTIGPSLVIEAAGGVSGALERVRSSGLNPLPGQIVRPGSSLSVEFSVKATAGAAYNATYVFRLTDDGAALPGASAATLTMSARPALQLTPGQRSGVPGDASARGVTRYGLQASSTSVHTPAFDLVSDSCVACHRTHTAAGSLLTAQPTQYSLCASCHDGTNLPDIAAAYAGVPANDATARAYYQHDPTQVSGPGKTNDCAECHNPHNITDAAAAETVSGWTASGMLSGIGEVELEYQLCYRCHASAATLPSNSGQPPSRYALDKALEFDPGNASYHPIESPGTNQTAALANSLAASGTSPYKLWSWQTTSTIRCVNCHADARRADAALTPPGSSLAASASLAIHASPERGILIQPYQDRSLNGPIEPYAAADFALCYVCHSEAPFVDQTGQVRDGQNGTVADTNFRYHGVHLSNPDVMSDRGFPGTDIDTPGYGAGFAICAECHFRIHSSAFPADGRTPGSRLVNFAPNVTAPTGGVLSWQPVTGTSAGSCTLKCHGAPHNNVEY
ncbi:MAG TPA: cytochrome c3 family protein [Candidatus Limnocylindrales bacterium]|jgi:predicted CXXCH cytochrome family protein